LNWPLLFPRNKVLLFYELCLHSNWRLFILNADSLLKICCGDRRTYYLRKCVLL
jgi:hypothetical protein